MARGRAAALEKSLSRLTIVVPTSVSAVGPEVRRDGVVVGSAAWGTAIPIDPGSHVIAASAPGKKPWSLTVSVGPNGASRTVTVGELEAEAPAQPVSTTVPSPAANPAPSPNPPPTTDVPVVSSGRGDTQRLIGVITGIAGVAGLEHGSCRGGLACILSGDFVHCTLAKWKRSCSTGGARSFHARHPVLVFPLLIGKLSIKRGCAGRD